jgi:DNA-binding CsgD family transcriptional regulator
LSLIAGTASVSQTILIYLRFRKPVIKYYGLFLLALFLFLLSFITELYGTNTGFENSVAVKSLSWLFQAAGGITFILFAPYFYHTLMGVTVSSFKRVFFFVLDVITVAAVFLYIFLPEFTATVIILNILLFGMIAYGISMVLMHLRNLVDSTLVRALRIFLLLSIVFFPLLYLDVLVSNVSFFAPFRFIEGMSLPFYFLILTTLSIVFGLKYLNRPAYREKERFTDHFLSKFGITPRETEIISLLFEGRSNQEIGETLFISSKTVENHIYNIYQKLGVKSRIQLYQLVRANSI